MPDLPLPVTPAKAGAYRGNGSRPAPGRQEKHVLLDGGPSFAEVLYIRGSDREKEKALSRNSWLQLIVLF
jgi:hypothetical protein